jgi:RNA polymerase sigma factor (sigma-70 family)
MEMNFEKVLLKLTPKLKGIALRLNGRLRFIDEDDLMQEMSIHLWKKWKQDELKGKTESYMLQSCWFHIKNYLRTVSDKTEIISIDEPNNNKGTILNKIIPYNFQAFLESIMLRIIIEKISENGLTKREKEVFVLCLEGYTLREIGERLNISFVRVSKIKKNICRKWGLYE